MSLVFDLHSHTTYSDGTLQPEELISRAKMNDVDVLALTDHDSTAGLERAQAEALKQNVYLIHGVEISTTWNGQTVHVVGLNVDFNNAELQQGLSYIREQRTLRARKMAEKLAKAGIPDALAKVTEMAGTEAATRTHFARFLVENGHVKDMKTAFKKWLGHKGRAFVGGHWVGLDQGIEWIKNAGGSSVVAHPMRYRYTRSKLERMLDEFIEMGGNAVEVATSSHNEQEKTLIAGIANKKKLLASAGSDFHTPGNPRIDLGKYLKMPESCTPVWQDWNLKIQE